MSRDDDLQACAELLHRGDCDRFLATMAAPMAARGVLLPLFAFNLEVARAPWVTQESMIAEMRLQWWRDALEEIGAGGAVRRHEVVTPLSDVVDAKGAELLDQLVVARRWDIYKDPFEDAAHIAVYLDKTSANLLWVVCRALGAKPDAEMAVRDVGYAMGVANWLRAIPALEAAGRVPLVDGRTKAVAALASEALARLHRARKKRHQISEAAMWPLFSAWQSGAVLKQAMRRPEDVAAGGLGQSDIRKRSSLMMRVLTKRW